MGDTLTHVAEIEKVDASFQCGVAGRLNEIFPRWHDRVVGSAREGVDDVIHCAKCLLGVTYFAAGCLEAFQSNAAGTFVQEHSVYIYETGAITQVGNLMFLPDFLNDCFDKCQFCFLSDEHYYEISFGKGVCQELTVKSMETIIPYEIRKRFETVEEKLFREMDELKRRWKQILAGQIEPRKN